MINWQWLDRLRNELRKRNLPAQYSDRLIEELTDHLVDIQTENKSMDAQKSSEEILGSPELVASAAQQEFFGWSFAGRHPALAFMICPIPFVALTFFAMYFLIYQSLWLVDLFTGSKHLTPGVLKPTTFEWCIAYGFLYVHRFLPFGLTAWFFMRLARYVKRPLWGLIASGLVALIAIQCWSYVYLGPGEATGKIVFGFGFSSRPDQWLQAALPIGLGLWAWRRMAYQPMATCPPIEPSHA